MSAKRRSLGSTLSKNLLQMKFMQKTKERTEQELDQLESESILEQQFNENLREEGQKYVVDTSYLYVERLGFGRMSFKGMNPEIEKLMVEMKDSNIEAKDEDEKYKESVDVDDQEMADRYSRLMGDKNRKRYRNEVYSKKQNRRQEKFKKLKSN